MEDKTDRKIKHPTKQSTTVRISEQSHRRLREMAAQTGEPMQTVLGMALEQYRRQKFWEECNAAYAALQQDPAAWQDLQDELKSFEGTLMDGLDPGEDWSHLGEAQAAAQKTKEEKVARHTLWRHLVRRSRSSAGP